VEKNGEASFLQKKAATARMTTMMPPMASLDTVPQNRPTAAPPAHLDAWEERVPRPQIPDERANKSPAAVAD
jgi:hypothetical protein